MILNASAENGSSSLAARVTSSPFRSCATIGGTSSGEGRYQMIASSSGCTPLFLNADPHSTGTPSFASVARRIARRSSSMVGSSSWTNFSMSDSSWSARRSNSS